MLTWDKDIYQASSVLLQGGIILYPTDTIWGIGCLATDKEAVTKVYELKRREDSKSMLVLVESVNMLRSYVKEIPDIALELMDNYPKALTLIYPNARKLPENLIAEDGSIGIRIVKDLFCTELIKKVGAPIVATSANLSGDKAPAFFGEIDDQIKTQVDYIVEWRHEEMEKREPSAIINILSKGDYKIIRS